MIVRLEITSKEMIGEFAMLNRDDTYTKVFHGHLQNVPRALKRFKKYGIVKWKLILFPRLNSFFKWLGMQNDYLFPLKGETYDGSTPFKKAHLWKTRIGFKTAWELSK